MPDISVVEDIDMVSSPPPSRCQVLAIALLVISAVAISITGLGCYIYYATTTTADFDVLLTTAVVSTSNASSLLIEADWLLTFDLDDIPNHPSALEASVLYDELDGGGQLTEVAAARSPALDVGWRDQKFSIRLAAAAGDGRSSAASAVRDLGDMIDDATRSVEFQVRLGALTWADDVMFGLYKWKMTTDVDCDSVRMEFLYPRRGGSVTGILAKPALCHPHGRKIS
ncbi:unnamed protein product [Linum trigynum]|uniref:Late embryogenesis abundant protein LEA-2 subgroup domain-containing protein n=1 Tax=Linum trigynum TaxID=586398 RepID=A0AAV2FIU5_9ROSI